ncbi:MAG: cold shock domain-containing protein [Wolbachia endosymbiont of Tyrophagus putrescentiae]|nr:cold shock domain-containing protein [Wolbachia endosymbiont of Tyrophagus putrescentiae]
MEFGHLKWFSTEKGYGFITPEGKGADVFVHISTLESSGIRPDELRGEDKANGKKGQKVGYDLIKNREGKISAKNLKLLEN